MMKNKYTHVIKEMSDRQLIYSLYLTQGLLLLLSFIIGIFLFEDFIPVRPYDEFQSDFVGLIEIPIEWIAVRQI